MHSVCLLHGHVAHSSHSAEELDCRFASEWETHHLPWTAASMVDMRVLGKPSIFAGDEASWKSWSFVMLSLSAAVSPELRAFTEKARTNVVDMLNVNLTAAEQVWSRQLYYMLSLSM